MSQNPYEAPKDAGRSPGFNWRRLCLRGIAMALLCFVVGVIAPMFRFRLTEPPILAWGLLALAVLANIGFFAALLAALVGGIGWAANALFRRN
jgi:hypothetical protein